ncbi:MAG: hypothetical protein WCS37_18230 [Chloroflexota bacterium]|nr:hypothetical protein [Chloroflexota bacterium]
MEESVTLGVGSTSCLPALAIKTVLVCRTGDSVMWRNLGWFKRTIGGMVGASNSLLQLQVIEASEAIRQWAELLSASRRIIILQEGGLDLVPGEVSVFPSLRVNNYAHKQIELNHNPVFWQTVALQTLVHHNPSIFVVEFGWYGEDTNLCIESALQIVHELIWQVVEWSRG